MTEIKKKEDCVGCGACMQRCPRSCISMHEDEQGFLYPKVNTDLCINCHLCERVCPVINQAEPRKPLNVYAAKNTDEAVRLTSSSGGVFSILAENTLRNGGVVYGAAFDEQWNIAHRRVDTVEGIAALRGSKYAFSRVGEAYADAIVDLEAGRHVLFSGTPCQIAAIRKRVGENPNLLLIEVVCHGAPKHEYWTRYLAELCQIQGKTTQDIFSINFRDKRAGWKNHSFTIRFADGKEFSQPHDDNLYMRAFLQNLTLREACFRCPSKYPDGSRADISLGDLWGIEELAPELNNDLGTSLIIARTQAGEAATSLLPMLKEIPFADAAKYNPAITTPATPPINYNSFTQYSKGRPIYQTFRKFAKRSVIQALYLRLARLKQRLFNH